MLHELLDIFSVRAESKSNDKSNELRLIGNKRHEEKNWPSALFNYNKALMYAKSPTVASLTYGNRSAVYFEVKRYQDCIQNIQWARENGYPQKSMAKLNEREAKCMKLMNESMDVDKEDFWNLFKLSYPSNKNVPWIVDRVEVHWTENFGRGIYAKEDLKAGDIIAIEEPIISYPNDDNNKARCFNCFKSNALNLIPCDYTASMMFCSTDCKNKLYEKAIDKKGIVAGDIKMLSEIAAVFGSVKNFDDYMQQVDIKDLNKTIFDYDLNNPDDPEYKKNLMMCLLSLSTNERRVPYDCKIRKKISEKAAEHLLSIYNLNFHKSQISNGFKHIFSSGLQIPLFASLMNYSCIRNALVVAVDNKLVTTIQKPIKAGEQIFLCYPHPNAIFRNFHVKMNLEETQMFTCECELCAADEILGMDVMIKVVYATVEPNHEDFKEFDKARDYLKNAFNELNTKPLDLKVVSTHMFTAANALEAAAYNLFIPF